MGVEAGVGAAKGLWAAGSALKGFLSSKGMLGGAAKATEAATTAASAAGSAAAGGGLFAGLAAGMTALAGGVGALGAVLLSPPGIAFSVTLVAVLLALGGALRLAAPALEVFGNVAVAALGKAVEAFGMFVPVMTEMVKVGGGASSGLSPRRRAS
jgi:hypothetical protein